MKWRIRAGTVFSLIPISKVLVDSLTQKGMELSLAQWWVYRQTIRLGASDPAYDARRRILSKMLLKGGD